MESILDDFENSSDLINGYDEAGIPLISINDFDTAITELKQCYSEIKDNEASITELHSGKFVIDRLIYEHYQLGKNVSENNDEMSELRNTIEQIEKYLK